MRRNTIIANSTLASSNVKIATPLATTRTVGPSVRLSIAFSYCYGYTDCESAYSPLSTASDQSIDKTVNCVSILFAFCNALFIQLC